MLALKCCFNKILQFFTGMLINSWVKAIKWLGVFVCVMCKFSRRISASHSYEASSRLFSATSKIATRGYFIVILMMMMMTMTVAFCYCSYYYFQFFLNIVSE